jgi:metacaspase-1
MHRAVSIHIGVNEPGGLHCEHPVLKHSEEAAWRMAVLASQAGYESLQVLRGRAATRLAVHEALTFAAGLLEKDDNLLVTFSGHGGHAEVPGDNEKQDESWCLFNGDIVDDKLAGYWRLFEPGVRIVVVSESCYSGGIHRNAPTYETGSAVQDRPVLRDGGRSAGTVRTRDGMGGATDSRDAPAGMPGGYDPCDELLGPDRESNGIVPVPGTGGPGAAVSCVTPPEPDSLAIRAKVLMLTASAEKETAIDGVFTCALLRLWNGGAFRGSYCELYHALSQQVLAATHGDQRPQILIGGTAGPDFPLETAFHLTRDRAVYGRVIYRGKDGERGEGGGGQTTHGGEQTTRDGGQTRGGEPVMRGGGQTTGGGEPVMRGGGQTRGGEPGMRGR